jgi:outer membrane protein assembly factor BamA
VPAPKRLKNLSLQLCRNAMLALVLLAKIPTSFADTPQDCSTSTEAIEIKGNKSIRREYLLKWSKLHTGQLITQNDLIEARQDLLNTGYFSDASVSVSGLCQKTAVITIQITEKHFQLIYPRINRNANGDIEKGFRYRGYQLFGRDQNLFVLASRKNYAEGDSADLFSIDYELNLLNLPYLLRWHYQTTDTLLADTTPSVTNHDHELSFLVGRAWHTGWLDEPVDVYAKLTLHDKTIEGDNPSVTTQPGAYHTIGVQLDYDRVNDGVYRLTGYYYSIELSKGLDALDTDFDAFRLRLEARYYHPLNTQDNLNARFLIDVTSDRVFNQNNYSIGGGDSVRGLERGSVSGNTLWLANIEYVSALSHWPEFHWALFTDIGSVSQDTGSISDKHWAQTYGVGLRWKIKSFVKTTLVIDYAFDPDTDYSKAYLSTSTIF